MKALATPGDLTAIYLPRGNDWRHAAIGQGRHSPFSPSTQRGGGILLHRGPLASLRLIQEVFAIKERGM